MPNPNNIVFGRASFDLPTNYLSYWLGITVSHAIRLHYNVVDLFGDAATKQKLQEALVGTDPAFVCLGGHGGPDEMTLQDRETVITAQNANWMAQRLSYFFSCLTGQRLSQDIVAAGGEAFLGYNEEFGFIVSPPYVPSTDPRAKGFMEAGNAVTLSLLRGYSIKDAYNSGVREFNKWLAYWENSLDPLAPLILTWLESDRDSLVAWGNLEAKLSIELREAHPTGFWPAAIALAGTIAPFALVLL